MESVLIWTAVAGLVAAALFWAVMRKMNGRRPRIPHELKAGNSLPEFQATNEAGQIVNSRELLGAPAVILFVRGNWCPFCTRQVEDLTRHYNDIVALGAKLVFVTPKPLQTTRRVAEFFKVEFEFWLDDSLTITRRFGLVQSAAVPEDHRKEYGADTIWPTSLVVDAGGIIRYAHMSRFVFDRPQPAKLLRALRNIPASG